MKIAIITYTVEVLILLCLCALLYHFLLQKSTNISGRRFILKSTIIFSFIMPILFLSGLQTLNPEIEQNSLKFLSINPQLAALRWGELIAGMYVFGAVIALLIVGARVFAYANILQKLTKQKSVVRNGLLKQFSIPISHLRYAEYNFSSFYRGDEVKQTKISRTGIIFPVFVDCLLAITWPIPIMLYFRNQLLLTSLQLVDRATQSNISDKKVLVERLYTEKSVSFSLKRPLFLESRFRLLTRYLLPNFFFFKSTLAAILLVAFSISIFHNETILIQKSQLYSSANFEIQKIADATVIQLKEWQEPPPYMEWAGQKINFAEIEKHVEIQFDVNVFSEIDFKKFQKELPIVFESNGNAITPASVRISITGQDHISTYNLECDEPPFACIHEAIDGMGAHSSIQLVFKTVDNKQLYCILTDQNKTLYVPQFGFFQNPFIFDVPASLKSYGVEKMSRYSSDYQLFWGDELSITLNSETPVLLTPKILETAVENLPVIVPIHGGLFGEFNFLLTKVGLDNSEESLLIEIDDSNADLYLKNKKIREMMSNLSPGDVVYLESVALSNGKNIGSAAIEIVDTLENTIITPKRNFANFNFIQNGYNIIHTNPDIYDSSVKIDNKKFAFKWGTYYIPVEFFASPNQYKGKLEIAPEAFKDVMNFSIEVYQNDELINPDTINRLLSLNYFESIGYDAKKIPAFSESGDLKLNEEALIMLQKSVHTGMTYRIHGSLGDIKLNALEIQIIDPDGPYEPPINLLKPNQYIGEEFPFQIVQGVGDEKTILKIDSFANETESILKMYRDDSKYTIHQIPGFKTRKRVVVPTFLSDIRSRKLNNKVIDDSFLRELSLDNKTYVTARWGKMAASPVSGNYSVREFRSSCYAPFNLYVNNETQNILQADIRILSGEKIIHHFQSDEVNHRVINRALQNIQSKGSVYITNLIVEGTDGLPIIFPQDFVFVVE